MAATRSFLIATALLIIAVAAAAVFIVMRPGPGVISTPETPAVTEQSYQEDVAPEEHQADGVPIVAAVAAPPEPLQSKKDRRPCENQRARCPRKRDQGRDRQVILWGAWQAPRR